MLTAWSEERRPKVIHCDIPHLYCCVVQFSVYEPTEANSEGVERGLYDCAVAYADERRDAVSGNRAVKRDVSGEASNSTFEEAKDVALWM